MVKKKSGKRRSGGGSKKGRSRRKSGFPGWLKTGAKVAVGAVVGALFSPLTGPVSGAALGILGVGLATTGFSTRTLVPAGIAGGVQVLHTAERSSPFNKAKAVVADAAAKLKYGASAASSSGGGGLSPGTVFNGRTVENAIGAVQAGQETIAALAPLFAAAAA